MTEETIKFEVPPMPVRPSPYESNDLNKLFEALAKAQEDMEVAGQNSENPYFKSRYSDLASLVKASRPSLSKNGLSVIQRVIPNGGGIQYLFTRLCHSSGQWMESRMAITPPKQDIQSLGSYLTYLRRYNYGAMTGVVSSGEDDDGEKSMESARSQGIAPKKEPSVSKQQLGILSSSLDGHGEIVDKMMKGFNISKLSDLPAKHFDSCLLRINELINLDDQQ